MRIPTLKQAEAYLAEAQQLNPGPWVAHSHFAAQAAQAIAQAASRTYPDLDPQAAYLMGLLHDIGRRAGVTDMRHLIDGYNFLHNLGYEDVARICITHSYPIPDIYAVASQWDCSPEETQFIKDYIANIEYTPYDRLMQLCDCLALPSGFCLVEKRLVDVALRYGVNEYMIPRWKAYLHLLEEFDAAVGGSVYSLLPRVVENTFGAGIRQ